MDDADNRISVVINTYNAQQHLDKVLQSVKDFDEIVVCDMESTDDTRLIAESYGARVVTFPKKNYQIVEPAREFAIHQVSHPWVLVVDADEIVTPQLRKQLYHVIKSPNRADGYFISRHNRFMGAYSKTAGHDYILRFFLHAKTHWPETIHSVPVVNGRVERMDKRFELMHLADETMRGWVTKMNDYTDYEVEKKAGRHFGIVALFWRPLWRFVRSYLLMGGFRNGERGLLQAVQWAMYQQVLVSKIMEKKLRENNE